MEIEVSLENYIRRELLEPQGRAGELFTHETSLFREGILDSFGLLELTGYLETRFDIAVRDEDMIPENFDNLGSIARFVAERQAANT